MVFKTSSAQRRSSLMKKRQISELYWNFLKFGGEGVVSTLPPSKEDANKDPLRVIQASVVSCEYDTRAGELFVKFDRVYNYRCLGMNDAPINKLNEIFLRLNDVKLINRIDNLGSQHFNIEFSLPKWGGAGFCEEAIMRMLAVFEELGVNKSEIIPPTIIQRTLVCVPESKPLQNSHWGDNWGWFDFGVFLGDKFGLSSRREKGNS